MKGKKKINETGSQSLGSHSLVNSTLFKSPLLNSSYKQKIKSEYVIKEIQVGH